MLTDADILAAVRRTDQALCEQLAVAAPLEFGTAYCSPRFAPLPEANQLRDVWLADLDGAAAFDRAEAFFAEQGATCRRWTPAAGQDLLPVADFMAARGWRRVERLACGLTGWSLADETPDASCRVLPAGPCARPTARPISMARPRPRPGPPPAPSGWTTRTMTASSP